MKQELLYAEKINIAEYLVKSLDRNISTTYMVKARYNTGLLLKKYNFFLSGFWSHFIFGQSFLKLHE
jgi:hypothetical protein